MAPWLTSLIAAISTALCLFLWFREVLRVMRERESTVESAAGHLTACQEKARKTHEDPETYAVLERSRNIYRQAVNQYNRTLRTVWVCLPAHLMGYRRVHENERPDVAMQTVKAEHHFHKKHAS